MTMESTTTTSTHTTSNSNSNEEVNDEESNTPSTTSSETRQKQCSIWTDSLKILPIPTGTSTHPTNKKTSMSIEINIASFNILAESYLTPRSHKNLPDSYANIVFHPAKRRNLLCSTIYTLATQFDILCLQEVDLCLHTVIVDCLESSLLGFGFIYCPRGKSQPLVSKDAVHLLTQQRQQCKEKDDTNNNNNSCNNSSNSNNNNNNNMTTTKSKLNNAKDKENRTRSDGCAIYYKIDKWICQDYDIVQFDDLADDSRSSTNVAASAAASSPTTLLPMRQVKQNTKNKDSNSKVRTTSTPRTGGTVKKPTVHNALPGITASYRRSNTALIVKLKPKLVSLSKESKNNHEIFVANSHLYWHPGYEYVKLSQAHYLLQRVKQFINKNTNKNDNNMNSNNENNNCYDIKQKAKVIVCGDMNSKPNSAVHRYFTKGFVDATTVAPWNYHYDELEEEQYGNIESNEDYGSFDQDPIIELEQEDDDNDNGHSYNNRDDNNNNNNNNNHDDAEVVDEVKNSFLDMNICGTCKDDQKESYLLSQSYNNVQSSRKLPSYNEAADSNDNDDTSIHKYLLDFTLNKFTRWLRILGLDAELETDEEERARTSKGQMILFERCKKEKRTLITTSKTLLKRKECPPGTYLVNPGTIADLEASLVHLLLLHSITLQPRKFLTRCVVCNGIILEVKDATEKKAIFLEFGYPGFNEDHDVYRCNNCGQGYWWSTHPQSSASRVKDTTAHLLRICAKGGVPTEGNLDFFDFVDVDKERKLGELERKDEICSGVDEVISWLRDKRLRHNFKFRSAYASDVNEGGEIHPFTNVTSDFVGALDYIFFEESAFEQSGRLYIPLNFKTLNSKQLTNGHLLPSEIWPSDHLAIGARLILPIIPETQEMIVEYVEKDEKANTNNDDTDSEVMTMEKHASPQLGCNCGCVPKILSLFEMAELRKQAREQRSRGKKVTS